MANQNDLYPDEVCLVDINGELVVYYDGLPLEKAVNGKIVGHYGLKKTGILRVVTTSYIEKIKGKGFPDEYEGVE